MDRAFAILDGVDDILSRADEAALDITGEFYLSFFVNRLAGANGFPIAKGGGVGQLSWQVLNGAGTPTFLVSGDGTAQSAVSVGTLTIGTWYFVECSHNPATDLIGIAVTDVASAALSSFTTAAHSAGLFNSSGPLNIGANNGANLFNGQIHSVLLANQIPLDSERAFLFAEGAGRDWWELSAAIRDKAVGFWQLDETSGNRASKKNSLTLTQSGGVAGGTRTVSASAFGLDAGPIAACRRLIASCPAFQDIAGGTYAAALAKTHNEVNDTPNDRPWALVMADESISSDKTGRFAPGSLLIDFELDLAGDDESDETRILFQNRLGKIVEEMWDVAGTAGHLVMRSLAKVEPISMPDEAERIDYYSTRYRLEYGVA